MRNSLLHMTNLDSRKVLAGKEKRIGFYVAAKGSAAPLDDAVKYFNIMDLIDVIPEGLTRWSATFREEPGKFREFVERYDGILSDHRRSVIASSGINDG